MIAVCSPRPPRGLVQPRGAAPVRRVPDARQDRPPRPPAPQRPRRACRPARRDGARRRRPQGPRGTTFAGGRFACMGGVPSRSRACATRCRLHGRPRAAPGQRAGEQPRHPGTRRRSGCSTSRGGVTYEQLSTPWRRIEPTATDQAFSDVPRAPVPGAIFVHSPEQRGGRALEARDRNVRRGSREPIVTTVRGRAGVLGGGGLPPNFYRTHPRPLQRVP